LLFGWRFGCWRCPAAFSPSVRPDPGSCSRAPAAPEVSVVAAPLCRFARRSCIAFSAGEPGAGIRRMT
jgi:hypothetical protein